MGFYLCKTLTVMFKIHFTVFCLCALRALCYLSLQMYTEAVKDCEEALHLDPFNIKALYRRAQAHKELKVCKRKLYILWLM